jgi:hypothetical protein
MGTPRFAGGLRRAVTGGRVRRGTVWPVRLAADVGHLRSQGCPSFARRGRRTEADCRRRPGCESIKLALVM